MSKLALINSNIPSGSYCLGFDVSPFASTNFQTKCENLRIKRKEDNLTSSAWFCKYLHRYIPTLFIKRNIETRDLPVKICGCK